MAEVVVKDYYGIVKIENKMIEKSRYEAIEIMAKLIKGVNRNIAKKIAEDIFSRYDVEIKLEIQQLRDNNPKIAILYRRKRK